ncbi:RagB/SusD family nutrient uptake outer membrane protein [Hymenobacter oligotrophus]|uniref:RagB/SusD family nutrient uptake outer membrane protein n=1 Tax=Hymenobacter oligotrophus TaxID=2319843 RepID=A0A3B7R7G9_9BACT|nr:RagB/SusD family nutrient uptake outer membrane protein [Hymenobacter oligotrophus]AYA35596.1 RagB/SusD family nutrient uptake outer membrane protein [Hymenobacter oligotrophus]
MLAIRHKLWAATALLLTLGSCGFFDTDPVPDPNNPSLDTVLNNASRAQLDALAVGVEASYRNQHTTNAPYNQVIGTFGREVVVLAGTESRWYGELQGTRGRLDDAAYYNAYYVPLAQMRRAAQVFRESANNSQAYNEQQKQGVAGFTYTYEALAQLLLLNMQGENGIRTDVSNVLRPGPFVTQAQALTNIRQLLDQGAAALDQAGTSFGFTLSSGFAGFNTPATFRRFNRGLAARVALYQRDYAGTLTAIGQSFYDPTASLSLGPKMTFNPATAGDQGNPYFQVPNTPGITVVAVPDNFVTEAETGDARLSKVGTRTTPRVTGGITGTYEPRLFASNVSSLDIMRNEELILIAAEAKANSNRLADALADVNVIRTVSGRLAALPAGSFINVTVATDEIIRQRRYSLFYEGHYFVDLRRLGRLPTAAQTQNVVVAPLGTPPYPFTPQTLAFSSGQYRLFDRIERPAAEKAWDAINP